MQAAAKGFKGKLVGTPENSEKPETTLKRGFLSTKKRELTILLVGQADVEKTALLNLIANILHARGPMTYRDMHNTLNQAQVGHQTNKTPVYEFRSVNGVRIRLLDVTGLSDICGSEHDENHKASVVRVIRDAVPTIDGVLIIANGSTEHRVATEYSIPIVASIFPHSIADNVAIIFTMVSDPTSFNFQRESLPSPLHKCKIYLLNNPISLVKHYQDLNHKPLVYTGLLSKTSRAVRDAHTNAVEMFSQLFDWLDQCMVQPTSAIVKLYEIVCTIERRIQNALPCSNAISEKKREADKTNMDRLAVKQVKP